MQKGKFGICLWFYAVLGFVLAIMNELVPCVVLLGFVIAAEKNEWAAKQVMQGLFLCIGRRLVLMIPAAMYSVLAGGNTVVSSGISALFYAFNVIVFLTVISAAVVGTINAVRGNGNGIPLLAKLANRAFGIIEKKVFYQSGVE